MPSSELVLKPIQYSVNEIKHTNHFLEHTVGNLTIFYYYHGTLNSLEAIFVFNRSLAPLGPVTRSSNHIKTSFEKTVFLRGRVH